GPLEVSSAPASRVRTSWIAACGNAALGHVGGTPKFFSQLAVSDRPSFHLRNGLLSSVRNHRRRTSRRFGTPRYARESDRPRQSPPLSTTLRKSSTARVAPALTSISA